MITTIFFDFAGVIATTKLFPKLADVIASKSCAQKKEIEKALYTDAERFVCGLQSTRSFWEEFLQSLDIPFELFELEMQTWYTLNHELLAYIDQLRAQGFTIHVLSDNFDVCTEVMRKDVEFTKHFQKCYFSNEVHLSKSSTEFFEYALNDAGVTASESLFIDDKAKNVAMAEKIGMSGVVFLDVEQLKGELGVLF